MQSVGHAWSSKLEKAGLLFQEPIQNREHTKSKEQRQVKKAAWKRKIKQSCIDAGTYQPFFEDVIATLADVLEKRDDAGEQYKKYGSKPVITYTNKGGNTNPTKNPMLILWDDLNRTALTYWRELGLTPSGYKKITGDKPEAEKGSGLMAALASLEV